MLKPSCTLIFLLAALPAAVRAQSIADTERFLTQLLEQNPRAEIPRMDLAFQPLERASETDLRRILPSIERLAATDNVYLRQAAAFALFVIALPRMDNAKILSPQLGTLSTFLNDGNAIVADAGLQTLGGFRPVPNMDVMAILLQFAERRDRDEYRQAGALWAALQVSSVDTAAVVATERFASRDLSVSARLRLMDGIVIAAPKNKQLQNILVSGLADARPEVRRRAIYNWTRLGPLEMQRVAVELERLRTQDPSVEVRAEADKALQLMRGDLKSQ